MSGTTHEGFPQQFLIEQRWIQLYEEHPDAHPDVECYEGNRIWSVLSFQVNGRDKIAKLRKWMVEVFVPKIIAVLLESSKDLIGMSPLIADLASNRVVNGPTVDPRQAPLPELMGPAGTPVIHPVYPRRVN